MALCWLRPLLRIILLFFSTTCVDASFSLSSEVTKSIPACALTCFTSFIQSNFPTSVCTSSPSLECICSKSSSSGYTAGEGAVQCVIAEKNVGFCTGTDAENDVAAKAFIMCSGVANAIPNTHKTITASIVVQTSSIVFIAPASTTLIVSTLRSLSTSSSSISSSTSTSTTQPTTPVVTSSPPTSTATSNATTNSSSPTPAKSTAETSAAAVSTSARNKVIGISVASVGGAALVVGLLLLFVCLRRRRHRLRDSDMLPFQADPGSPRFFSGFRGPMEKKSAKSSNGSWPKSPPRVPPRLDTSDPYMFSRRSIKPDTIGLAISPERAVAPLVVKRSSRLLPDKPVLTLDTRQPTMGPGIGLKPGPPNRQLSRESTATQFEEDDSTDTAVDETYGRGSTDRFVNIESLERKTIKVVAPERSYPGLYVTNPDNFTSEPSQISFSNSPEYYVKPLDIGKRVASFSRPRPGPDPNSLQLQVPARTTSQNINARPITTSSSVYSSASNTPYTAAPPTGPLSGNAGPIPPLPDNQQGQQNQSRNRKSYKQTGPYDNRTSTGSFTSFDTFDSISPDREQPRHTLTLDLSPVVESPASATGVSPVTYPKINPPRRLTQQTIRMVPPPAQPDFASVFSSGGGRTQPVSQVPVYRSNNHVIQKPWEAAELEAARQRRSSQAQARSQTYPIPQIPDPQPQLQLQSQNSQIKQATIPQLGSPFSPKSNPVPQQPPPIHTRNRSRDYTSPPPQFNQSSQQPLTQPRNYIAPSAHFNHATLPNPNPPARPRRSPSTTPSISSRTSTTSSLLTKRLGADRAAQLSLQTSAQINREGVGGPKWRVLRADERERAKEAGWRPQLLGRVGEGEGTIRVVGEGKGKGKMVEGRGGGGLYAGYGSETSEGGLPRTPGWMPKLTPTRRGDELFLSVA